MTYPRFRSNDPWRTPLPGEGRWFEVRCLNYNSARNGGRERKGIVRRRSDGKFDVYLFGVLYDDWTVESYFCWSADEARQRIKTIRQNGNGRPREAAPMDIIEATRSINCLMAYSICKFLRLFA